MNTPKIFSAEQLSYPSEQLKITKRKRPNQPKTRTGCITCKIRRIKCDEQKPSCSKCLSTGRACDGYRTLKTLLFEICKDGREKRSFHYYRECTANEVCSEVDVSFWKGFVLRAGHHSEAVRHALTSVGSFHESLELETGPEAVAARCFAFEQYGKALEILSSPKSAQSISPILVTCVLVIWLENLQGHFSIALQHLRSGLQLLAEAESGTESSCIEPDLIRMLLCLGSQASRSLGPPHAETSPCGPTLPDIFLDVSEAHEYFYRIIHWICSEVEDEDKIEKRQWRANDSILKLATPLRQWQIQLKECVDCLGLRNSPVSPDDSFSTDLQQAYHLETQYNVAMIMLHAVPLDDEMLFDDAEQLERFADIVLLSQQALKLSTVATPGTVLLETSIITPLLMTACRCRDPMIRRKAISVLRSYDWRENIFGSKQTANICDRLMIQEEAGLGIVKSCRDVPSSNRFYLSYCTFYDHSLESRKLELYVHLDVLSQISIHPVAHAH